MGQWRAYEVLNDYGAKFGFSLKSILAKGTHPASWKLFAFRWYDFTLHAGNGLVVAAVTWPGYRVHSFQFYPVDGKSFMLPLWAAFPSFDSVTAGWRMGSGEVYRAHRQRWFSALSPEEKLNYKRQFPPPEEGGWVGFYDETSEARGKGTIAGHVLGR